VSGGRPSVAIRAATAQDAPILLQLSLDSIRGSAAEHYAQPQLHAWAGRRSLQQHRQMIDSTATYVAADGDRIAGFVSVALTEMPGLDPGEVDQLFVHPDYGGRGVGRLLLTTVEAAARGAGLPTLTAHASWRAVPVFERLGYTRTAVETVRLGDEALTRVHMYKLLRDDG
jgi:putative acetyltransferase